MSELHGPSASSVVEITDGRESLRAAALCALVCVALLMTFSERVPGPNASSRLATMDALVQDHTFVINNSVFRNTIDRVMVGHDNYSSKPPVLSVLGAGVYWLVVQTTDLNLRDERLRGDTVYLLTVLLAGVPYLLLLGYAHALLRWFTPSAAARVWSFACISLGQLGLPYSTTINNHVPAATAAFIAFYYAFGLRHGRLSGWRYWCYAGFAMGLAPTLDLGAVFISGCIGLYLLAFDWHRTLRLLVPAALVPILFHFALTWSIMGSLVPVYLRRELYRYPGSYWLAPRGIDALNEPRSMYLYNITLGHHGLFSMTPALAFALFSLCASVVRSRALAFAREAWTIGAALAILVAFYTLTTKNYGGVCVGFRWLLPIVPLALLFVGVWWSENRSWPLRGLFFVSLLTGQYHAYAALTGPWSTSSWHHWLGE